MKVCWRSPQPAPVDLDPIWTALQQTMPPMTKPAGQRLGRQVHRSSKPGRQVPRPSDQRLWGTGSKVSYQDQAPTPDRRPSGRDDHIRRRWGRCRVGAGRTGRSEHGSDDPGINLVDVIPGL